MANRRRRKRRPARRAWIPDLNLPVLEQRHWDLIGLALVAFAAFFACVFYLDWAGGEVGEALAGAILFMFGGVGYAAPVVMFAFGALIVLRPMIPALHPLKTGAACLTGGPDARPRRRLARPRPRRHRRATASSTRTTSSTTAASWARALFWASAKLFSTAGSHILFVFLLLAGVLLLTGASIASIVTATRTAAVTTTERVRRTTATARIPYEPLPPLSPPEPEEEEPVVRATHVEVPVQETDDFEAYEPEPEPEPARTSNPRAGAGRGRASRSPRPS